MKEKIKEYMFPKIDPDVQQNMDEEIITNIYRMSFAAIIFECSAMVLFLVTRKNFDRATWVSIWSVAFCIGCCIFGFLVAVFLLKREKRSHRQVFFFKVIFVIMLSAWAIVISYRDYLAGNQFITFFAVMLMLVCFVPLTPITTIIMSVLVYGVLYIMVYTIDGAKSVNIINYLVLIMVSISGMLVRFHAQYRMSERAVQLFRSNGLLEYTNRHDGLTGLLNRVAFRKDTESLLDKPLKIFMIDINYFKEINDDFGHAVGDKVLKETARHLKALFPSSRCYRYGGDEFLVLNTEGEPYKEDTFKFSVDEVTGRDVLLSIGSSEGKAESAQELFNLIAAADGVLYKVKQRTHSKAYGGHDRRRR